MAKNKKKKNKNKNAEDNSGAETDEEVEGAEAPETDGEESGEEGSDTETDKPAKAAKPAAGKDKLVTVINYGDQAYHNSVHGDLKAKSSGRFPKAHADLLVRLGNGKVKSEDQAKKEFEDATAKAIAQVGADQPSTTGSAFGGKVTQKTGFGQ